MDQIEQLPAQLARRNWIVLALLLIGSLPLADISLSTGILVGGLVAIGGFFWLRRSLARVLEQPSSGASFRYQSGYIVRLLALVAILATLIAVAKVHILGLIVGLSVVILNLLWTTLQRAFR